MGIPGKAGEFAKICWDDVNNGCGNLKYNAFHWMLHFEAKHNEKKDILIEKLVLAYKDYLKEVDDA